MIRTRFVLFTLAAIILTALTTPGRLAAQAGSIRGTVTDSATRSPLQGALVTVVGTAIRTETNSNGQYALTAVSPGTVAVRVQMIGYTPAERSVVLGAGLEATLDFALATGVTQLEEIVSVGYGTTTRGELSTAVSSVGAEELANQPISSVDGALQGKAPVCRWSRMPGTRGTA